MIENEELEKTMEINFNFPEYRVDEDDELEKTMEINFDISKYNVDEDYDLIGKEDNYE